MKKIIPLVLLVFIIGFVAFFFLNNNLAMSTLISQNYERITSTYNKAVKDVTKHSKYYYETTTKTYVNGKVSTTDKTKVSIALSDGEVSAIYATVTSTEYELEVYYGTTNDTKLAYVTKTPKGAEPQKTVYENATADYVLGTILDGSPVMFNVNGEERTALELLTKYQAIDKKALKDKVSSSISFSPLGAKFKYTVSKTECYQATIDVLGKLHSITHKSGTDTDYVIKTTDFVKYDGKVSIYWKNQNAFSDVEHTVLPLDSDTGLEEVGPEEEVVPDEEAA